MFKNGGRVQEWNIYIDGKLRFQERAWGTEEHLKKCEKKLAKIYPGCKIERA